MNEQVWMTIVVALVGIIIGGAGGATLFRKATKGFVSNSEDIANTAATLAATASSTAAVVASTATTVASALRVELAGQLTSIQVRISNNSDKLNDLEVAINRFMGACPEKHRAIEQRLDSLDRRN